MRKPELLRTSIETQIPHWNPQMVDTPLSGGYEGDIATTCLDGDL